MRDFQQPVRLLVVDEANGGAGVERMILALLPELARCCEKVVWAVPNYRCSELSATLGCPANLQVEPLHASLKWDGVRFLQAVISRTARLLERPFPTLASRLRAWNAELRIRALAGLHGSTHVLYPALFMQQFPQLNAPVFAGVMDLNYHPAIREECLVNLRHWAQKARALLTISDFTQAEAFRACGRTAARIASIPLAVAGPATAFRPAESGRFRLYYPASFNFHKGHAVLIEALRQLHDEGLDFELTLTGGGTERLLSETPLELPTLEAARRSYAESPDSYKEKVKILGNVTLDQVARCYDEATLVVLPTEHEGFGLPLSEAVSHGRPVICSDIPAFREQSQIYEIGRAIAFVPQASVAAWKNAIRACLTGHPAFPFTQEELSERFSRRTWRHVALAYVRLMSEATGGSLAQLVP